MFKNNIAVLVVAGLSAFNATAAWAEGTAEEAEALVNKGAAHYQAVGRDQALKDFSATGGEWQAGSLYIFCNDYNGVVTAHGVNAALIGKDFAKAKDADGKLFVQELLSTGKSGGGWVDYRWVNPTTKKIDQKSSYVKDFGSDVCGVGIYK